MEEKLITFPQSKLILFTSKLVLWTWFWLVLFLLGFIGGIVFKNLYFWSPLIIFLPSSLLYAVLAFIIKCPNCNKAVTVQSGNLPEYANENKVKGLSGWTGIILNVRFNKKFTCMHCGMKYTINTGDITEPHA